MELRFTKHPCGPKTVSHIDNRNIGNKLITNNVGIKVYIGYKLIHRKIRN